MTRRLAISLACLATLAGCVDPGGDYPTLLPTQQILAEPALPEHAGVAATSPAAVEQELDARGQDLRGRADALRGPVIEPEFQGQMQQAQKGR